MKNLFIQSTQSAFQEQHISDFNEEELLINLGDGDDGMDDVNMNGIDDIFGNDWDSKYSFLINKVFLYCVTFSLFNI